MRLPLFTATNSIRPNSMVYRMYSEEMVLGILPATDDHCVCQMDNKSKKCEVIIENCSVPSESAMCKREDDETCSCECSFM